MIVLFKTLMVAILHKNELHHPHALRTKSTHTSWQIRGHSSSPTNSRIIIRSTICVNWISPSPTAVSSSRRHDSSPADTTVHTCCVAWTYGKQRFSLSKWMDWFMFVTDCLIFFLCSNLSSSCLLFIHLLSSFHYFLPINSNYPSFHSSITYHRFHNKNGVPAFHQRFVRSISIQNPEFNHMITMLFFTISNKLTMDRMACQPSPTPASETYLCTMTSILCCIPSAHMLHCCAMWWSVSLKFCAWQSLVCHPRNIRKIDFHGAPGYQTQVSAHDEVVTALTV